MSTINDSITAFQTSMAHAVSQCASEIQTSETAMLGFIERMAELNAKAFDELRAQVRQTMDTQRARLAEVAAEARDGRIISDRVVLPQATVTALAVPAVEEVLFPKDDPEESEIKAMAAKLAPPAVST